MMMIVDADNLKNINDVYGHDVGDEYIIKIAEILNDIELNHVSARFGGDEYAVFVYGAENVDELKEIFAKIKERRGERFQYGSDVSEESLHYSIGVAYYPFDAIDKEVLMKIADQNMYIDKKNKKERYSR